MTDEDYMRLALEDAQKAPLLGEVPVGAVLVSAAGDILAHGHNQPRADLDPTAHAEIRVIRMAAQAIGNYRLTGARLFVTLEPCAMCAGAISLARIAQLIYAAADPKGGAVAHGPRFFTQPTCHHRPEISSGLYADAAGRLLTDFFRDRREESRSSARNAMKKA